MHGLETIVKLNAEYVERERKLHDNVLAVRREVTRLATLLATTAASIEDKTDEIREFVSDEVNELYAIASALVREAEEPER